MENKETTGEALKPKSPDNKNKKLWVLLGVLLLMVIIIVIVVVQGKRSKNNKIINKNVSNNSQQVQKETTKNPTTNTATSTNNSKVISLKGTTVVVPGANPIAKDDKVLTTSGQVTKTDVSPASSLAPQQTLAISKKTLSASVIKLNVSAKTGFIPNSFTVKAGAPITVSITNQDTNQSATLGFVSPLLSGVILGTGPSETRAITFNAPTQTGNYKFIDGIPGHTAHGIMIVK